MKKRMIIMLIIMALIFGGIFGFQIFKNIMIKKYLGHYKPPAVTVTTITAENLPWKPLLNSIGSVRAVQGVDVTTEVAGLVRSIYFKSGDNVEKEALLVQLNADSDVAALHSLQAAAELSKTNLNRDAAQLKARAVSQATVDTDMTDLKSKLAQVDQQQALVDKKSIRAPFSGKLGITTVNLGQYLNTGDKVVSLQNLDTVFIDFALPQQYASKVKIGQKVKLIADAYLKKEFEGTLSAIDPKIDTTTRNMQFEATVENPNHELMPGMFVNVDVEIGKEVPKLTLPQTAISFNPYGATVFVIKETLLKDHNTTELQAKQVFVTTGETRGDQVEVLSGVVAGDVVVTSGQLKLKNNSEVEINNSILPSNDEHPKPVDQ